MSAVARETSDEQQLQAQKGGDMTYTRSWKVVTDTTNVSLFEIQAACGGVATGQPGPNGTICTSVRLQGTDSRYLYKVQAEYSRPEATATNPLDEDDTFSWSFSTTTAPAVMALPSKSSRNYNKPIVNSAGDPLENVSMDIAEVRLKISGNRAAFPYSAAIGFVNCVNSDSYAGGEPGQWKCMGVEATSATAEIDDGNGGSYSLDYWKVNIDLAWRGIGWGLKLLNVGYNEKVGDKKVPIALPRVEDAQPPAGNDQEKNLWRADHRCTDVQALDTEGKAKAPGQPPEVLEFDVYTAVPFAGPFPQPPAG